MRPGSAVRRGGARARVATPSRGSWFLWPSAPVRERLARPEAKLGVRTAADAVAPRASRERVVIRYMARTLPEPRGRPRWAGGSRTAGARSSRSALSRRFVWGGLPDLVSRGCAKRAPRSARRRRASAPRCPRSSSRSRVMVVGRSPYHLCPVQVKALAVVASLGLAGPRSAANRPSQPAPSSVLAEVTRQPVGRLSACAARRCARLPGVLGGRRRLVALRARPSRCSTPRLERLPPGAPSRRLGDRGPRSRPAATPPPHPSHPLCDRGPLSAPPTVGLAVRGPCPRFPLLKSPDPLMGVAREEEENETQRANHGRPRGSLIIALGLRASARACASVAVGLGAGVLPAGSARLPIVTPFAGPARM